MASGIDEEQFGGRTVAAARTSVAAFVAKTAGPAVAPVRCLSWREFEGAVARAGAADGSAKGRIEVSVAVWAAVHGWFDNGGGECWLVPVSGQDIAGTGEGVTPWGLAALERIDEVTIVVAPDLWSEASEDKGRTDAGLIAGHCAKAGNRMAVLHMPEAAEPSLSAEKLLGIDDSSRPWVTAYYPWINVAGFDGSANPLAVPPTGHVAGVWARVDAARGIHKTPANEPLRGVVGLTRDLDDAEHAALNDQGVNALRVFPDTGPLVWGARTLAAANADNLEHAYLNVQRTANFIKQSVRQGTEWVVFEPNDERLRSSVTAAVTSFLTGLWRQGVLRGESTEQAFYVVCDESNNPPQGQGQLAVDVGVALARPAEFITFGVTHPLGEG